MQASPLPQQYMCIRKCLPYCGDNCTQGIFCTQVDTVLLLSARRSNQSFAKLLTQHQQALLPVLAPSSDSLQPVQQLIAFAHLLLPWSSLVSALRSAEAGGKPRQHRQNMSWWPQDQVCPMLCVLSACNCHKTKLYPCIKKLLDWLSYPLQQLSCGTASDSAKHAVEFIHGFVLAKATSEFHLAVCVLSM